MPSNIKVLQVIPKLGYGGAETGCYDIAHYLPENNCKSFIVTSGGELLKFVNKDKVKLIRLPVHSKNPLLMFLNSIFLIGITEIFRDLEQYRMIAFGGAMVLIMVFKPKGILANRKPTILMHGDKK